MDDCKNFLTSKTIWGLIITVAGMLLKKYGFDINVPDLTAEVVEAVGIVIAIYGRIKASKSIVAGAAAKSLIIPVVLFLMAGCANQSAQSTTAKTFLAMHDFVKISATAADGMCKQGIIKPEPCMAIKTAYNQIKVAYPLASDALLLYLQSGSKDALSNFLAANALFLKDYQEISTMLITYGVIKEVK